MYPAASPGAGKSMEIKSLPDLPGKPWKTTMSNGKSMAYYWYINEPNGSKWV